jgi:hypothetical protein
MPTPPPAPVAVRRDGVGGVGTTDFVSENPAHVQKYVRSQHWLFYHNLLRFVLLEFDRHLGSDFRRVVVDRQDDQQSEQVATCK